jgi:phospho-N-acetylmuramoyl-pentapeptide-transferase
MTGDLRSILQSLGWEVLVGAVISAGVGALLLFVLPRLGFRQTAYEDAPATHRVKSGTLTMGGIAILAALLPSWLQWSDLLRALLFLAGACAVIGFIDDYLAVRFGRNRGLRARTKYLATALVAIIFLRWVDAANHYVYADKTALFPRDTLIHVGAYALTAPHWLWLLLGILAITATVHAVNLTDGLDGLAAGSVIPPLFAFWAIAVTLHIPAADSWPIALALGLGGCLGFLIYNRYPARIIMGDTGSLALGALLAGAAILTGEMLLLILVGGVFVAEALSVILQVAYFKATGGKRIFRMSPLHHHFELSGWPERKVTAWFWAASLICSLAGLAIAL